MGDEQPQPGAGIFRGKKRVKDLLFVLGRYPCSRVPYFHPTILLPSLTAERLSGQAHRAPCRSSLQRIEEEIHKDLFHLSLIGPYRGKMRRGRNGKADSSFFRLAAKQQDDLLEYSIQINLTDHRW